jgi:N-acetyl-gamma-glutamyl-phosphate reductase
MAIRVFIDGAAGTTGLEIRERLQSRRDIELSTLAEPQRKNLAARKTALNEAAIVILCLPDGAAREAVALIENPDVRVIDASSAHRAAEGWTYGFPELEGDRREELRKTKRVSNPGCYPTGFLALMRPLLRAGVVPPDFPITCNAVSGYSGGGREMIAEFEGRNTSNSTREVFRIYGLQLEHKHVPEMHLHSGLVHRPIFAPGVARFYRGMIVEVPLQLGALTGNVSLQIIHTVLADAYPKEPLIELEPLADSVAMKKLDAEELKNTDRMKLYVFGSQERRQARLVAVLDNLGKGAAGACVQNLNAMLGLTETLGLVV